MNDILSEATLRAALGDCKHLKIVFYPVCGSTNLEAKKLFADGFCKPTLIVAKEQTAGRGRQGRAFYSPAESGVYFTLLHPAQGSLGSLVPLTAAAAVAVMRAIRDCTGRQTQIKWVNDLTIGGRKVCGILSEGLTGEQNALAIGVGINLRPAKFPPELAGIAGSVGDTDTPRSTLIAAAVRNLLSFLNAPTHREWLDDYRKTSCVIGHEILILQNRETRAAKALDVGDDGELIVQTGRGIETLRTGEITVRMADQPTNSE